MSQLAPLEAFDCEGDATSVGLRWEKWKRGLEIYLLALNIDEPQKKRATLLHVGGLALQEIFHNIPGAFVEHSDSVDVYQISIQKLDEYFAPKQCSIYERHRFRLLKQEPEEKFEKFLIRLRHQSTKCKFTSENENLIDQITEKCTSPELRKRILMLGDSVTLDKIISEANIIEAVERQLTEFSGKPNPSTGINKIDTKRSFTECTRCGSKNHKPDSNTCPAKFKQCIKCGFTGHFRKQCKTRASKRLSSQTPQRHNNPKRMKPETSKDKEPENKTKTKETSVDYIFHIDDDSVIECQIGGVDVELLIDSGSKCNIVNDETWRHLKECHVVVSNQQKSPDKTFMAYGSKEPLTILGSFDATITAGKCTKTATFYVVKHGTRNLLGKDTAIAMGVLKIGFGINNVTQTPFPKFKDVVLDISINKSVSPVSQPYRRIPIPLENKINDKLTELVKMDIIEPVNKPSAWVSPMVPVLKSDGDIRICVDMRCANKAIEREHHPLPTMEQLIPKFRKAKFFSKLDIKNAFHQVELKETCRYITTFITNRGLFQYKRLMFGICCAPEHFQKIMERMLLGCDDVVNFIDDIVVFGEDECKHNAKLTIVLEVLKKNNVLLNDEKCIFNTSIVKFLGHELSHHGVRPLDKYVKVVDSFREPKNIEEIQSFLGLVNFVNKWIPNLATLTEPIRELTRQKLGRNTDITPLWQQKQKDAFHSLKKCLSSIPTLGYYDPHDRTQVMADASPVGLGAVLIQYDTNGPRIISFGNKSLSDVEKRYCQTEKEALALVWAIEHFKMYLYGKKFELVTDHKPLEIIFGPRSKPCARIERWVLRLQAYDYKIVYRSGKSNIADPLSRLCHNTNAHPFDDEYHVNQIVQYARPNAVSFESLKEASSTDNELLLVKQGIMHGNWDESVKQYKLFEAELWVHEGLLLRGNKIVIPSKLRPQILDAAHEGHPGVVAMKGRLRTKVWWPKIDREAENKVKCCKGCTLVSGPNPPTPMKRREFPTQAWVDVAVDFLGPLPSGHYLFVVVDYYSRYKEIKVMKTITAKDTISVLKEMFSRLGVPVSVTCDNGPQFTSEDFKTFCREFGVRLYHTIPYWPQQNGEVERQNRDILKRLKISQTQKSDWRDDLLQYLMMCNSTPHSTTGKTPSELFYRRTFRDKIPSVIDAENQDIDLEAKDKDQEMKQKGKMDGDRKRKAAEVEMEIGEKVYVKNMAKDNKLASDYNPTPHTVVTTKGNEVEVRNDVTGKEYRRNIIHLKKVEGQWEVQNQTEQNLTGSEQNIDNEINIVLT